MAKPKWTPGPWQIIATPGDFNDAFWIGPEPLRSIAEVRNGAEDEEYGGPKAEAANARLIAAAPELYDALGWCAEQLEGCWLNHYGDNPEGGPIPRPIAAARAALARARGES